MLRSLVGSEMCIRDSVGIILNVTPHINDNGMVRMEINQEVSQLSTKTIEGINSPIFSQRVAETTLSVADGQTIVIGGLIQQSRSNGYSGVPWLGRIPGLRYLVAVSYTHLTLPTICSV